jgi:hypothetical protein
MSNTTPEQIIAALQTLDSGNDGHWTDDGLPRVDVIQALTKDPTLKRKDIEAAKPGWSRADLTQNDGEPNDPAEFNTSGNGSPSVDHEADELLGVQTDEDTLRQLMLDKIERANERLQAARAASSAAREHEFKCTRWLDEAKIAFHRRFPPMTANAAIKAHIAAQQRLKLERVDGRSQIDITMGDRGRRGTNRPQRGLIAG